MTAPPADGDPVATLKSALHVGDDVAALGLLRRLIRSPPPPPDFVAWLWQAWDSADPGAGRGAFDAALKAARQNEAGALRFFTKGALGAGHGDLAVAACRRAMLADPAQSEPVFLLCALLLRQGSAEAQSLLQQCLARFPEPSRGWMEIGEALLRLGKREAALVCFDRGPAEASVALRRGQLAKDLGRLDQARAAFAAAVALDTRAPRAWFLLGTCAQDQRDFAAAAEAYRRVLALTPTLAEAAVNLGTVLQETGDLAGARASYARALATRPDSFGRVAQALATSPTGELWLDLDRLRASLVA